MSTPKYLSPKQAAEMLPAFQADWFYRQLRAGKIRGSKVGGRWFIEESAVVEMIEAASNDPARSEASTRRRRRRAA